MNKILSDAMINIDRALSILPDKMRSERACVQLLAIGLQESRLTHRAQLGGGPARGLLQFEKGNAKSRGGVWGVMNHQASHALAGDVALARRVLFNPEAIWAAMENDDVLCFAFGRLLLYTDVNPLPTLGNQHAAWDYYIRCWNPGKPHPQTWAGFYGQALTFVREYGL